MKIRDIGEIRLIERFRRRICLDDTVLHGSGDDAAVIRWKKDRHLLFTCDMLVEDVHFTKNEAPPFWIGHKSLAVNISDIAAMGGIPKYAVVSTGFAKEENLWYIDKIFSGIKGLADKFGINIVGGDVNTSKKIIIDISLLGEVKKASLVLRSGAKAGDAIMVTGKLGGSGKGRHLRFMPRIKESQLLVRNFKINSMIDISDGLSGDLKQICRASDTGAVIYESLIPVHRRADSLEEALSEGEDFELLFTLPCKYVRGIIEKFRKNADIPVTPIGQIVNKDRGIKIINRFGKPHSLKKEGYKHF